MKGWFAYHELDNDTGVYYAIAGNGDDAFQEDA